MPRNYYMDQAEIDRESQDVIGSNPYYTLERSGPFEFKFGGQPGSDTEAMAMNRDAMMNRNAVPQQVLNYIWAKRTPRGLIYTTGDKLFAGSDFTDADLSRRDAAVRQQGWFPVNENAMGTSE